MSVSKSFLFPALLKNLAPNIQALGLWFRWCLGGLFENSAPSPGVRVFFELRLRPRVFFENNNNNIFPFFYSKAEPVILAGWQLWRSPGWAKHFGDGTLKTRIKLDFRALARSSAEGPSLVVAIGTSRVRWSMVQKRKNTRKSACDCAKAQRFIICKPASFEEPVSETRCRYRFRTSLFSWSWMDSCRTVRLQRGESEEKQSSVTLPVLITEA